MSDLFAPLRSSEPDPATPPAEVRRRGDRIRRRRTTAQTLGAALAVGLVVSGGVLLDGTGSRPAGPADRPTATATTDASATADAPADDPRVDLGSLDLTRGFPGHVEATVAGPAPDVPVFEPELRVCGSTYPGDRTDPVQRLAVELEAPELVRFREVTVYADAATAQGEMDRFVGLFQTCPEDSSDEGLAARAEVRPAGLGDEGHSVLRTYLVDDLPMLGMQVLHAVRVENVLLLTGQSDEGSGALDMEHSRARVATMSEQVAPLVRQLTRAVQGPRP